MEDEEEEEGRRRRKGRERSRRGGIHYLVWLLAETHCPRDSETNACAGSARRGLRRIYI